MRVLHRLGWLQFVCLAAWSVTNAVETPSVVPGAVQSVVPAPTTAPSTLPDPDEPLFAAPTSLDRIGRILAPVMINGQGPFRFLLDTGANYSTVSPLLLNTLGLQQATDQSRLVHGVTGTAYVPTVLINRFEAGTVKMENAYMPIVESSINLRAHGILGVAGLQESRVYVDFKRDSVVITRARLRREERGSYFVLDASRVEGGLLAVNVTIRGVRAKAIIDTGAAGTLGNMALKNALRARHRRHPVGRITDVFGATEEVTQGESELTASINIGDITVSHVDVTYGDFHIFEAWNLTNKPAMLIGMDVLGTVDALIIDFRSSQVLVKRGNGRAF